MKVLSYTVFSILCAAVALVSFRFIPLGLEQAFPGMISHIAERGAGFLMHVAAAPVALFLGVVQFLPSLRARWPRVHRISGRIYVLAVLVGAAGSLMLVPGALGGGAAGAGFAVLAVLWVWFTVNAARLAMAGRIEEHRRWMLRSFALTFAAVTLRLMLPVFFLAEMTYAEASVYLAWISWIPNLLVVEWAIWRARVKRDGSTRPEPSPA